MQELGISTQMQNLVKSFLSNRRIMVKVEGYYSQMHSIDNGIPQGSPLSVVLFTIYINSLAKAVKEINCVDYVGIYASGTLTLLTLNW